MRRISEPIAKAELQHVILPRKSRLPGEVGTERVALPCNISAVNVRECWQMLYRQRLVLLSFAAAAFVAALLFSVVQTPLYRARTLLEIQDLNENFLNLQGQDPTASPASNTTTESYIETQIKILESYGLLERVVDDLGMSKTRPKQGWEEIAAKLRDYAGFPKAQVSDIRAQQIVAVSSHLTVRAVGDTHVVEILFDSTDPRLAADFNNTLVREFTEQSREMRWKSTQDTSRWLTGHLTELKENLEAQESELQDYARNSGLLFASDSAKEDVAGQKLLQIQEELAKAHEERVRRQAANELAKTQPTESLSETLDDQTIMGYQIQLTDLKRHLAELSATLTPEHPRVRQVQSQIFALEAALAKQRGNILQRSDDDYQGARRREYLLAQAYSNQAKLVSTQASKAIHYNTLKNEADATRQLYDALLQRVKQGGLAAAMRASNVLIVDAAKPPLRPYRPNYALNTAVALLGGIFLGFGFVVFREHANESIRSPGIAPVYSNLPELGVIPLAEIVLAAGKHAAGSLRISNGDAHKALSDGGALELITWQQKSSMIAEAFRATLTSILMADANREAPQVVVVTSAGPAAGKTTVATNLGIAMAEIGRRVLLIDGDLRRPRLHRVFNTTNDAGFSDALTSNEFHESAVMPLLIAEPRIPGLFLLPSGPRPENLLRLLYSDRLVELLTCMRSRFDFILIDAPPLVPLSDARVFARHADGVLFIIRAGETTPETLFSLFQRFEDDGTRVLGTILNSWDVKSHPGHGYAEEYGRMYRTYEDTQRN